MKKLTILSVIFLGLLFNGFSQTAKVELLFFKANLGCCASRYGDQIIEDTREIIQKKFSTKLVSFKVIEIADVANKDLVAKHNAKSQTVVIMNSKKKTSEDISSIIALYVKDNNEKKLETALVEKINNFLK